MEKLVPDKKPDTSLAFKDPVQRGHRPEAIRADTKVMLREPIMMGWCSVIGNQRHPLEVFQGGLLFKPRIEVQPKAAFQYLFKTYHPDTHA